MKVISIVTRYSAIFPFSIFAFWLTISSPLIPRTVLAARSSPWTVASSKLFFEEAVIFVTRATAMGVSFVRGGQTIHRCWWLRGEGVLTRAPGLGPAVAERFRSRNLGRTLRLSVDAFGRRKVMPPRWICVKKRTSKRGYPMRYGKLATWI